MDKELRCIVLTCNDFQGDDPVTVKATMAGARFIKQTFDAGLDAAREKMGRRLTPEEEQKLLNMTVTVKVMKVRMKV